MLPLHYQADAPLPLRPRDFPQASPSHIQHAKDSSFLLLMVIGYLLALGGGIVLLGVLTPVSHSTSIVSGDRTQAAGLTRSNP